MTYTELTQKYSINYTRKRVDSRPDGLMDGMTRHYHFRIYKGSVHPTMSRSFGLYFSQGSGHTDDPTFEDVLDCLASDASSYENAKQYAEQKENANQYAFEYWASEYGYDTDSRKAEKIYKTVKRQAEQLKRTIGEDAYNELLWETERL